MRILIYIVLIAVELIAVDAANTIANVAIPSVILTITPVGA